MCKKVDVYASVAVKGIPCDKANTPVPKVVDVLIAPCVCRNMIWAYVMGGTPVEITGYVE